MKKKLLAFLVCLCLALGAASSVTAFAGVNLNSPTGTGGLLLGAGLDATQFALKDDATPSNYTYQLSNTTYDLTERGQDGSVVGFVKRIPKADVVEESKFVMQFDVWQFTENRIVQNFSPLTTLAHIEWDSFKTIILEPAQADTAAATVLHKPSGAEVWIDGEKKEQSTTYYGIGYDKVQLTEQRNKGRHYVTFWFEVSPYEGSMSIYSGYDNGVDTPEKTLKSVLKNVFTLPTIADGESYSWGWWGNGVEFDNFKVYRTTNGTTDKTYANYDFESGMSAITSNGASTDTEKLIIGDANSASVGRLNTPLGSEIIVTNPTEDSRIVSKALMAVDDSLATTFEMNAEFKLDAITTTDADATRKVGIALGLEGEDEELSQAKKASFIYLTAKDAKTSDAEQQVYLGAVNIENGVVAATGTETLLAGVKVGNAVSLALAGKNDGSVDVTVNKAATVTATFPAINASGAVAIAHMGTGAVTIRLMPHSALRLTVMQQTNRKSV